MSASLQIPFSHRHSHISQEHSHPEDSHSSSRRRRSSSHCSSNCNSYCSRNSNSATAITAATAAATLTPVESIAGKTTSEDSDPYAFTETVAVTPPILFNAQVGITI